MSQDLTSAAPWRTAASMSPIFTLEENCTDTEAGSFGFLPVCKEEASPEQQVKSPSLVQVKLELPQIKEEQVERNPSLVQVKLEPPQIKEEQEERSPSLVQEKLEPPQIKEEQEEILLSPGEVAGSSVKLQALKSEDDDENRETECLASTSTEHTKTQAYIKYWVPSQPTSDDQFLSSHYSESDTDDSNDWTRNDETVVNTLESHNTHVEGQRLSLSNKLSQNLKSFKQKPSRKSQTRKKSFSCTECGKVCGRKGDMHKHMRIHTGEKPFVCKVCSKRFTQSQHLKTHMKCVHPLIKLPNGSAGHSGSQVDTTNLTSRLARHTVVPIRPKLATNTVQVSTLKIVTLVAPGTLLIQSIPRVPQTLRGSAMTIVTPGAIRDPHGPRQGPPGAAGPPDATGPTGGL